MEFLGAGGGGPAIVNQSTEAVQITSSLGEGSGQRISDRLNLADPLRPHTNEPGTESEGRSLDEVLAAIERREILGALDRAKGQRTMAAQILRISRSRLYRRMEALGIRVSEEGPPTEGEGALDSLV